MSEKFDNLLFNEVAFNEVAALKYEEAIGREEENMVKRTLSFLRKMIICNCVLSENASLSSQSCYQEALRWKEEYQRLSKANKSVYYVPSVKEEPQAKRQKTVFLTSRKFPDAVSYINGGRTGNIRMV